MTVYDIERRITALNRRLADVRWHRDGLPLALVQACRFSHYAQPSRMQRLWRPLDRSQRRPGAISAAESRVGGLCASSVRFPVPACRLREGMALLRVALHESGLWSTTLLDQLIQENRLRFGADLARCENTPCGPLVFLPSLTPCAAFWLILGHEIGHGLHFLARQRDGMRGPVSPLTAEKHALRLERVFGDSLASRTDWTQAVRSCQRWRRQLLLNGHWRLHRFECSLYQAGTVTLPSVRELWHVATHQPADRDGWVHWFPENAEPFYSWVYPVAWRECVRAPICCRH